MPWTASAAELVESPAAPGKPPSASCRPAIQATPLSTAAAASSPGASASAMTAIAVLSTSESPVAGIRLGQEPSACWRLFR